MTTKTLKLNKQVTVAGVTYQNIVAAPCAAPYTQPTKLGARKWACPPGTWVNPGNTNKNLTLVCLWK